MTTCPTGKIILSLPEDISIREAADHIFKRPSLSISPDTLLPQVATFLAIGPQIYVDGIVVIVGKDPVGRISSKHVLQKTINSKYTDLVEYNSIRVDGQECAISRNVFSLATALKIFGGTEYLPFYL